MKRLTWIIVIILTMLFWAFVLFGCVSHRIKNENTKLDTITRRSRYNHWEKPYKMYEPVKQHKPNIK